MSRVPELRMTKAALQRKLEENRQAREKQAHEAAFLAAQLRNVERRERLCLWTKVGQVADVAGLLVYDLGTLAQAFVRLAALLEEGGTHGLS